MGTPPSCENSKACNASSRLTIGARQQHARFLIGLDHQVRVARADSDDIIAQTAPQAFRDHRDHAEIHEDEQEGRGRAGSRRGIARQGVDEEVARMRVGVQEVVDEDLFQVGVVQLARQLRAADAGGVDGGVSR